MNDDGLLLIAGGACIAGKPRSYEFTGVRDLTYSYSRSAPTLPRGRSLG